MHEDAEVDARAPGQHVPWHRPFIPSGYKTSHHPKKGCRRDCRGCIHADRTPAPEDDLFCTEGTRPNWRSEKLYFRGEAGELLVCYDLRIHSGGSYLVNYRPFHAVLRTQYVCIAVPLRVGHPGNNVFGQADRAVAAIFLSDHEREEFGMLPLSSHVVSIAVESEKLGQSCSSYPVEKADSPTEGSRCKAQRAQCVADIKLAIPERTLSILPGLTPKNRRQSHEE